eukprot:797325-Amorphochlora_amoeboformis.AAC.1
MNTGGAVERSNFSNTRIFRKGSVTWRDVTLFHGISGTWYYWQGNLRAISGISSYLGQTITIPRCHAKSNRPLPTMH